jgi:hypothetical protein
MTHSATQVGSYLFIFGGYDGTDYCNDLLLFNLGTFLFLPGLHSLITRTSFPRI